MEAFERFTGAAAATLFIAGIITVGLFSDDRVDLAGNAEPATSTASILDDGDVVASAKISEDTDATHSLGSGAPGGSNSPSTVSRPDGSEPAAVSSGTSPTTVLTNLLGTLDGLTADTIALLEQLLGTVPDVDIEALADTLVGLTPAELEAALADLQRAVDTGTLTTTVSTVLQKAGATTPPTLPPATLPPATVPPATLPPTTVPITLPPVTEPTTPTTVAVPTTLPKLQPPAGSGSGGAGTSSGGSGEGGPLGGVL